MAALVSLWTTAAYFSSVVTFICGIVRGTGTAQLVDFNSAATLISFILFGKWLESKAKASTGDAIASLLTLEAPTALFVEEDDGVLVEREVDAKLLLECIASSLVLSTTSKLGPNYDQNWNLVAFDQQQLAIIIVHCIPSLVLSTTSKLGPNYDQNWNLVAFDQQQLAIIIVHCILFWC